MRSHEAFNHGEYGERWGVAGFKIYVERRARRICSWIKCGTWRKTGIKDCWRILTWGLNKWMLPFAEMGKTQRSPLLIWEKANVLIWTHEIWEADLISKCRNWAGCEDYQTAVLRRALVRAINVNVISGQTTFRAVDWMKSPRNEYRWKRDLRDLLALGHLRAGRGVSKAVCRRQLPHLQNGYNTSLPESLEIELILKTLINNSCWFFLFPLSRKLASTLSIVPVCPVSLNFFARLS